MVARYLSEGQDQTENRVCIVIKRYRSCVSRKGTNPHWGEVKEVDGRSFCNFAKGLAGGRIESHWATIRIEERESFEQARMGPWVYNLVPLYSFFSRSASSTSLRR